MNRRWRNLILPRKRRFDPPWAVVAATPPALVLAIGDQGGWRPRWTPLARRGRFLAVPPPATAPTAPTYVPAVTSPALRQRALRSRRGTFTATAPPSTASFSSIEPSGPRPRWIAVRRGRFQTVPQSALFVAPFVGARRARVASVRHGQFQALPQVSAPAVSQFVEPGGPRQKAPFLRRGRFLPVPPTVVTAGIGPVVSPITEPAGPRARTYTPRRGTFFQIPLVGVAPAAPTSPPGFLVSNRPTPLPTRRGLTRWVPPATLGVPDQLSPTRASLRPTRRGRLLWTPPTQSAAVTPWTPEQLSPNRTARPTLARRGRFWVLAPAPVVAVSTPVGRIKSRRPAVPPIRRGNILDNWAAIVSMPGFVCQDFATTPALTAYTATVSVDAYAATTSITADSATLTVDAYGGTATNCGR